MKNLYKKWFSQWLSRRIPQTTHIVLNQKRIFIMPNKTGLAFSLLLLLLFITAINYQNSLMFFLTFFLSSILISGILNTYRNLSGLHISAQPSPAVFVGENIDLQVNFEAKSNRRYFSLCAGWPGFPQRTFDVTRSTTCALPFVATKRGPLKTTRLRVETRYPIGLLTAWTWLSFDFQSWVYPEPIQSDVVFSSSTDDEESDEDHINTEVTSSVSSSGIADEFLGVRSYVSGDPLKQIAWKQSAKGQGLMTKTFTEIPSRSVWLSWFSLSGYSVEERLSRLCGWVLACEASGQSYGLILPTKTQPLGEGRAHQNACLLLLAQYGFIAHE
jgi:uncharacterized protein (DUF58 family)